MQNRQNMANTWQNEIHQLEVDDVSSQSYVKPSNNIQLGDGGLITNLHSRPIYKIKFGSKLLLRAKQAKYRKL